MGVLDPVFKRLGYQRIAIPTQAQVNEVQKSVGERDAYAQDPLSQAFASINTQWGIRKPTKITLQTLRKMSQANWVDRTCIDTLRDEISSIPWDIVPINDKQPYDQKFQQYAIQLLKAPNPNNENWRTFIDKVIEDILVVDAGCIEKVRTNDGMIKELWHIDGATIKPCFDAHGVVGDPAYEQFLPGQKEQIPLATFKNKDLIYIMWNPQGSVENFGYGLSPVESGLAVATAFLYAEAYNLGFFRQNTIPPVVINMGKEVNPGEVEKFRMFLASEMMGPTGFHSPIVGSFNEGFDIKPILTSPKDMAWEKYVEWQMRWKVALYRMSPQDIGFTLDQYKVEGQVQQQLSKNKAIDSLKGVLKSYIDIEILNDESFIKYAQNLQFVWIDADAVDPLNQASIDKIYLSEGVKSINEVRIDLGLDPIQGGTKPVLQVSGTSPMIVDSTPLLDADGELLEKTLQKNYDEEEGTIAFMADNTTAICWMDDRGVTQPFFVTDQAKTKGFQIKPTTLDSRKEQDPPEAEVASLLRSIEVNTPEVKIMTYDEVLRQLPEHLYSEFTKWISLEPPYDSQQWRQRWNGANRQTNTFIVTGYLSGTDLGNLELEKMMSVSPDSYKNAVKDLAKVWVAERIYYLGDRKPGHYIITNKGNGYGVDYQFYKDENSYNKTKHFLPQTLGLVNTDLLDYFKQCIQEFTQDLNKPEDLKKNFIKAFRPGLPKNWERIEGYVDIEKKFAFDMQQHLYRWYQKAVNMQGANKVEVRKATAFDKTEPYIVGKDSVYQNGIRYPLNSLPANARPSAEDIALGIADYTKSWDLGVQEVDKLLTYSMPNPFDMKVINPDIYTPQFERRINLISDTVDNTLKKGIDKIITDGLDQGFSYGEMADRIKNIIGLNTDSPDFPGWRAEMIARTESQWAVSEGMRQAYQANGIKQVNVSPAPTACPLCTEVAKGNPYYTAEAENLLPIHPRCRCVLVGDYSDLLEGL